MGLDGVVYAGGVWIAVEWFDADLAHNNGFVVGRVGEFAFMEVGGHCGEGGGGMVSYTM